MSGVTHFERRDRVRRIHAECRFCGKKIKATPRQIAGPRAFDWKEKWIDHLRDHLLDWGTEINHILAALRTAMDVAVEAERNR